MRNRYTENERGKKERTNAFTRKERPNCGIPKTVMKKKVRRRYKKKERKRKKQLFFKPKQI